MCFSELQKPPVFQEVFLPGLQARPFFDQKFHSSQEVSDYQLLKEKEEGKVTVFSIKGSY
jgi:hypothetical protein